MGNQFIGWVIYSLNKPLLSTSYHGSCLIPWNVEREIHCVSPRAQLGTGSRSKNWSPKTLAQLQGQQHIWLYVMALRVLFPEIQCGCLLPELCSWGSVIKKVHTMNALMGVSADTVRSEERGPSFASLGRDGMPIKRPNEVTVTFQKQ